MFVLQWMGLTIVGGLIGRSVAGLLSPDPWMSVFRGAVIGLGMGSAQWFMLRRFFPRSAWWVVATMAGWAFAAVFNSVVTAGLIFLFNINDQAVLTITDGIVSGFVMGISQWVYLRNHRTRAGWWIGGTVLSFMLGSLVVLLLISVLNNNLVTFLLVDLLIGVITAMFIFWILEQSVLEPNEVKEKADLKVGPGLWVLLAIAFLMVISRSYSGHRELYFLGASSIGVLLGAWRGRKIGALYGLAIGIIVGYFLWFILTCQFCN